MRLGLLSFLALACSPDDVGVGDDDASPAAPFERRVGTVRWAVDPFDGDRQPHDASVSPEWLTVDLFDDVRVDVPRVRSERVGGVGGWFGADGETTARLAGSAGLVAGTVRTGGRLYQIRPHRVGESHVVELDEAAMPPEAPPVVGDAPASGDAGAADGLIDQLVVYTAEAVAAAGSVAAMETTIALAIAETNDGFAASGIPQRVRLVGTLQVDYPEDGFDWGTALSDLQGATDGHMEMVHAKRDQVGADQVTLIVADTSACGLAYLMSKPSAGFAAQAFSVVSRVCATGYYSFGHELGHNVGSDHDHAHGTLGARAWSYGYQDPGGAFRTVMAYDCAGGCTRLNRWSNPRQTLSGAALGVSGAGKSAADNGRSIGELADVVSAFRGSVVGLVPVSALTSPEEGSRLSDTVSFAWTSQGASDHALHLGTTAGGDDLLHVDALGPGSGALAVSDLPDDGTRVHARLWSLLPDGWTFADTSYLAAEAPSELPGPPVLSPAAGSVLPGDSVIVRWADTGATEYHVYAGTEPGGYDLASRSTGTTAQATLTGLPVDGGDVWVRVWAYTPDVWVWTDVVFVAATR